MPYFSLLESARRCCNWRLEDARKLWLFMFSYAHGKSFLIESLSTSKHAHKCALRPKDEWAGQFVPCKRLHKKRKWLIALSYFTSTNEALYGSLQPLCSACAGALTQLTSRISQLCLLLHGNIGSYPCPISWRLHIETSLVKYNIRLVSCYLLNSFVKDPIHNLC